MNATPAIPPTSSAPSLIRQRQDEPEHLRRLLAYSYLYRTAQRWHRCRAAGTLILATIAPVVSLLVPASSDILAAIAAGWLVAGRTVLAWLEDHRLQQAASVQELYDTRLFRLPWNTALAGREPAPEDAAAAAAHIRDDTRYRDWYSIDTGGIPWPGDVVLCQRMSLVWGRHDHQAYGTTILAAGTAWLAVGLVLALARDLSLAAYLIKIFLPGSPALLDCAELARAHWRYAGRRQQVEQEVQDLWDAHRQDPAAIDATACRSIQDAAYLLRRHGPRVPEVFYRLRRKTTGAAIASGVTSLLTEPSQED